MLASYDNTTIGGAVYFHFGDKALYKFGASDKRYQDLRANNLIMWEAIRHFIRNGCKRLSFGRTEPGNKGLLQFKEGWGAEEYVINYYRYAAGKESFVADSPRIKGVHNRIFSHMPIPVLRLIGSFLYRHVG